MSQPRCLPILEALVGFDTVSRNPNRPLADWVEAYLRGQGVAVHRVADETGQWVNLFATIGPADVPGFVLSGHTDTVPVDGQPWSADPFRLRVEGGRAFGRGTCDMKGFDACVLAMVPAMLEKPLARPIHIALSFDEEVGCKGVRLLIAALDRLCGAKPLGVIVGEPTGMEVVIAHKGKESYRTSVIGTPAHSSLAPTAVNAVEWAAELVVAIRDIGRRLAREGPFDPLFDVPHSTAHVGQLHGGTTLNIVPELAWFDWEFRTLPEVDLPALVAEVKAHACERMLPAMRAIAAAADIRFEQLTELPPVDIAPDHELTALAKALAGRNGHKKVAYGTEGGLFRRDGGIPAIVCGPGNIEQAHKPDEYVELAQLAACEAFLERLIAHCRG
ncbi:MAG: acetylornithine deacetylase [Geminicoccaceae bacterium]|nr:acetylornithine deacetylase [Geminicoccaceae bacterium]MDW8371437.1 acetylornithine deacetylase [Geminicoccaceae bacterium]